MLTVCGSVLRGKPLVSSRTAFSCSDLLLFDVLFFFFIGFWTRLMRWVCVLYAGECQSYPEHERLPND